MNKRIDIGPRRASAPPLKAIMLSLMAACFALTAPNRAAAAGNQPDVLILVYASLDGQDKVGITYPTVVPHTQVTRDLAALQANAGWAISHVVVSEGSGPSVGPKDLMTAAVFTAKTVISPQGHNFALEPVISAMRTYPHVDITYFVGGKYDFQGLHSYSDKYVSITLDQHGTAFSYDIRIRDPRFQKLNLPLYQPPPGQTHVAAATPASPPAPRRVRPWQVILVTLIAVTAGGTVYYIMARNA
jgi:hypothetical protein